MNYNLQIQKILLEVDSAATIQDKIKLQKQAINIADGNNDIDWGYELRSDLMYMEKGTSHCHESIPAFVWIMDTIDTNPDLFDENDILLKYKWMIMAAQRNADFSLEQLGIVREDFKLRMEANGHGLSTYYNILFQWFMQTGDFGQARKYRDLRNLQQPDTISHCLACDISSDVELELLTGNFDKAMTLAEELLSARVSCFYEPFAVLSKLLYYFARNKDNRAESFYQRTEEELSKLDTSESYLMLHASYLIFYTSLFHRERAWNLFEKYSGWEIGAEDYPSFYFAVNVLPLLKENGERLLNLNVELPYFRQDNKYIIQDLYRYYREKAQDLAGKFDKRNGNTYFNDTLNLISSL